MRNLRPVRNDELDTKGVTAIAYDLDDLILAAGPTQDDSNITLKRLPGDATDAADTDAIASWPAQAEDLILDVHSFPDTRTISTLLTGGDIVLVRQEPLDGEEQIEILGTIDAGIAAVAWSPDEELVAIATKADTVLLMTREFEPISTVNLSLEDVKVSNHVSVGWGKKETQFKGRGAAKALRDPTMPEHVDEGTLSALDDGRVTLTWRSDGEYFALNSLLEGEARRRIIRVYSREGVLESVSEPINGLEGALSFKPSGQVIAGVQRLEHGVQVVFFERNGLTHGEFDLRLSENEAATVGKNISLSWNVDSTVLAVKLLDRVQLWTMGNYHWYLKQEMHFGSTVPRLRWHPEKALHLTTYTSTHLKLLSYQFAVARGSVIAPHDVGLVAVADGKTLKVTPLKVANVPPPMAFDEIQMAETAIDVMFNKTGTEIAVLHSNQSVTKWECDYGSRPIKKAKLLSQTNEVEEFVAAVEMQRERESTLPSGDVLSLSDNGMLSASGSSKLRIPGVTSHILTQSHLIYTTSNHLLKFIHLREDGDLSISPDEPEKDERCRSIERGAKIVTVMPSAYSLVLQMPRGNLETIYPRALVLAGIRRNIDERDYKKAFLTCRTHRVDMNILHDYRPEQFMRDVSLFLKQVRKAEYVDLFLSSLSEENVAETIYKETLNAVALELPTTGHATNGETGTTGLLIKESKVNRICDAFLQVLRARPESSLQNVITAHVCKNPSNLEAGLALVSELRKAQKQDELEAAVEHICFLADVNQLYDTALGIYDLDVTLLVAQESQKDPREYLPYLQRLHDLPSLRQRFAIDNDLKRYRKGLSHLHALKAFDELKTYAAKHDLYNAAMELYRYDSAKLAELMRMHADFLSSRNRYKQAGIAYEYVGDYASAYEAYRSCSLWQECLTAAALVPVSDDELSGLATDLAASLEEAKDYVSAATVYVDYLNDLETAVKMLCKGYCFSEATRLIAKLHRPELFRKALDPGLVEASATMTEMLAEMKSQLNAQVPRLRELREKKAEDPMAFIDGADGGDDDIPDNLSIAPTDASTTGTFMTRYTNRSTGTLATNATRKTSKNRRREERKRARGKKGTVYEEEYIVNSIARLVERLNSVGEDVTHLVEALMRRAMRERAVAVEAAMQEVIERCESSMSEVFVAGSQQQQVDAGQHIDADDGATSRPWGGQGVLWEALRTSRGEVPVLKAFERLSFL